LYFSLVYVSLVKGYRKCSAEPGSLANCSFFNRCAHVIYGK